MIAEIGSGLPIIALRADIDALPIVERTNLDYASSMVLCMRVVMIFTKQVCLVQQKY